MHESTATSALAAEIAALVIERLSSQPVMPRAWFDHKEAAAYTRRSTRALDQAIADGVGPKVCRSAGGKRVYHITALDDFVRGGAND